MLLGPVYPDIQLYSWWRNIAAKCVFLKPSNGRSLRICTTVTTSFCWYTTIISFKTYEFPREIASFRRRGNYVVPQNNVDLLCFCSPGIQFHRNAEIRWIVPGRSRCWSIWECCWWLVSEHWSSWCRRPSATYVHHENYGNPCMIWTFLIRYMLFLSIFYYCQLTFCFFLVLTFDEYPKNKTETFSFYRFFTKWSGHGLFTIN